MGKIPLRLQVQKITGETYYDPATQTRSHVTARLAFALPESNTPPQTDTRRVLVPVARDT